MRTCKDERTRERVGARELENMWTKKPRNGETMERENMWRQENMRICGWKKKLLQEIETKLSKKKKGHCLLYKVNFFF